MIEALLDGRHLASSSLHLLGPTSLVRATTRRQQLPEMKKASLSSSGRNPVGVLIDMPRGRGWGGVAVWGGGGGGGGGGGSNTGGGGGGGVWGGGGWGGGVEGGWRAGLTG